ncbi:unnamed protein product [Rotaria magnacalcarata]|uniref:Uncharacterized protein n=1 Tax=Rotaria magnacalcarata TaxID=392030 RepID=A0A818YFN9_9BILA|nr:unnamed protein product [Rotaria magnacalcarata]CAF3753749.1 unnamed protein product [Rotaria magnacalcarata]
MTEVDDTTQISKPLTFEPLSFLANDATATTTDHDESRQQETIASDLTTNIITDGSKAASENHHENIDSNGMNNTDELNSSSSPTSKQVNNPEHATSNGVHSTDDFDNEDIQKKMNGVIHDISLGAGDDANTSRRSVTSTHLQDGQVNNSTPDGVDPSTEIDQTSQPSTEAPIRPASVLAPDDHYVSNEKRLSSSVQQVEPTSDGNDHHETQEDSTKTTTLIDSTVDQHQSDDESIHRKTETIDDDDHHHQRPSSAVNQNVVDETTNFRAASPKPSSSRVQSATSKRSVHVTPEEEPSTSGDEKRTDMSPSKLTPDAGNDTDIDNQEVANVARPPSRAMSPLNRPRSPTPNDSRKASINMESAPSAHATQLQSPTDDDTNHSAVDHDHTISPTVNNNHRSSSPGGSNNNNQEDDDEQKQTVEAPATFVSSASRRESTNQDDQQQTLRPTSALKTKSDDNSLEPSTSRPGSSRLHNLIATDERLKLVKSDEQLQIPTDEFANEQTHSPPQSPIDTQPMISADHSLDSNIAQNEQNRSRPTSAGNRKSPTKSMLSNEKGIDGEVPPLDDSTYHDIHQQQTHATDDKPASRRESQVVEKTEHISGSRRASASQQPEEFDNHREPSIASRRTSNEVQESTSHNGFVSEQQNNSRRESINLEQKPSSRKPSVTSVEQAPSKRGSIVNEQHVSSSVENANDEPKIPSRKGSLIPEQQVSSKRPSVASDVHIGSRRESTNNEPQLQIKRGSTAFEQAQASRKGSTTSDEQTSSKRGSITHEQHASSPPESSNDEVKISSRKGSPIAEQQVSSKRASVVSDVQIDSHRPSVVDDIHTQSRRVSTVSEKMSSSRKASTTSEHDIRNKQESMTSNQPVSSRQGSAENKQPSFSKRGSTVSDHEAASRRQSSTNEAHVSSKRSSITSDKKTPSRKPSNASEYEAPSNSDIVSREQQNSSREKSSTDTRKTLSRQSSTTFQQQPISQRETLSAEHEKFTHRNSHVSEHHTSDHHERKLSNGSVARKPSATEREHASRRASEQKEIAPSSRRASEQEEIAPSSRRASTNRDKHVASPRHSDVDNSSAPRASSHRSSLSKQDNQPISAHVRKGSHPTSIHSQDINHRQINNEPNLLHRDLSSPETDSPNRTTAKQQRERVPVNEKRQKSSSSVDDSDHHRATTIPRHSGQQSKRNSNKTTDETVVTPIIMDSSTVRQHSGNRGFKGDSDNEYAPKLPPVNKSLQNKAPHSETVNRQKIPLSNRSETRPVSSSRSSTISDNGQKPNWLKQIPIPSIHFSDNETSLTIDQGLRPQSPNVEQIAERNKLITPPPPTTKTLAGKKRIVTEGTRRKQQGHLSRRSSSAESGAIRMVDDDSLDSSSENNSNFETQRRRHNKLKKRDVETNTEDIYDIEQHKTQRSFFDERELTPQKPLKATKPLSDHFHDTHRHTSNKEQILRTPDTTSNIDTPTIRRTVKVTKDRSPDKDPVNVNVTVVVKKFAGTNEDGNTRTVTEAYFEPVQHPSEILPSSSTIDDKEKVEIPNDRPRSTDQPLFQSSEQLISSNDRQIQSDTEQIITEKQKKHRRPKRISRTCQTYECVFRRMERDQQHDLRATSDTEKNIQTLKSQLRPRKKSPKKNYPLYLSTDSFRVEELLPKSFHQSRKTISKSSALARSLSPQGGKLLILRPTLPFHHTDAVNVQRVCLQYAIDLIPNDNASHVPMSANRNKSNVLKNPEQTNILPMISASTSGLHHMSSNKSAKSTSNKSEELTHQRKNGGGV